MGNITDGFNSAWRAYNTDGVPASGARKPAKSEIRALGPLIEAEQTLSRQIIYLTDAPHNGVGDDSTNNNAAINSFLAAVAAGGAGTEGYIPKGVFRFTAATTPIAASNIIISGPGVLLYTGASSTPGDLVTIGDGVSTYDNIRLSGFRIDSNTVLTSGRALRIRNCRMVHLDISIDGADEGDLSNCYDGLWLDSSSIITLNRSRFTLINNSIIWSNGVLLWCDDAFIKGHLVSGEGTGIGILLAGNCADLVTGNLRQLFNDQGLRIDNSISGNPNNHIFITPGSSFDVNKFAAILVNDTSAYTISKSITLDGELSSTTSGAGLVVVSWNGDIFSSCGRIYNNGVNTAGSGIYSTDVDTNYVIRSGAKIYGNYGYGFDAGSAINVNCLAHMGANVLGNFSANVTNRPVLAASYPTYADNTAAGAGGLTAGQIYKTSAGVLMVKL